MRLWHYKLLPYIPNSQLLAQWRELNSIFKKKDKHILINYIYEYPMSHLMSYSEMVLREMNIRGMKVNLGNDSNYTKWVDETFNNESVITLTDHPFENHHNSRYINQCFYNLQEKFDRGQKDFTVERYNDLLKFCTDKE